MHIARREGERAEKMEGINSRNRKAG